MLRASPQPTEASNQIAHFGEAAIPLLNGSLYFIQRAVSRHHLKTETRLPGVEA